MGDRPAVEPSRTRPLAVLRGLLCATATLWVGSVIGLLAQRLPDGASGEGAEPRHPEGDLGVDTGEEPAGCRRLAADPAPDDDPDDRARRC